MSQRLSQSSTITAIRIVVLACPLLAIVFHPSGPVAGQSSTGNAILDLIYRQKYNEALTKIEEVIEVDPKNSEALTYLATARLYQSRNFFKAQQEFKEAFKAGGGATFFVNHSHEVFTTGDVVDYCRGWLHLRQNELEFSPIEGNHGFKLNYGEVKEFKINRLSKRVFHIKAGKKNQNFRGRTNTELEPVLIIALYKSFTRT